MKAKHPNFLTLRELECQRFLNMTTTTYPSTPNWGDLARLLADLDEQFPDVFPDHTLSDKEIAYRAGQISIIRLLKQHLSEE
tara:strand:- start:5275 stop:5520 length:246 start_codon:yes stop_codon:yes gene_type:complete